MFNDDKLTNEERQFMSDLKDELYDAAEMLYKRSFCKLPQFEADSEFYEFITNNKLSEMIGELISDFKILESDAEQLETRIEQLEGMLDEISSIADY